MIIFTTLNGRRRDSRSKTHLFGIQTKTSANMFILSNRCYSIRMWLVSCLNCTNHADFLLLRRFNLRRMLNEYMFLLYRFHYERKCYLKPCVLLETFGLCVCVCPSQTITFESFSVYIKCSLSLWNFICHRCIKKKAAYCSACAVNERYLGHTITR